MSSKGRRRPAAPPAIIEGQRGVVQVQSTAGGGVTGMGTTGTRSTALPRLACIRLRRMGRKDRLRMEGMLGDAHGMRSVDGTLRFRRE